VTENFWTVVYVMGFTTNYIKRFPPETTASSQVSAGDYIQQSGRRPSGEARQFLLCLLPHFCRGSWARWVVTRPDEPNEAQRDTPLGEQRLPPMSRWISGSGSLGFVIATRKHTQKRWNCCLVINKIRYCTCTCVCVCVWALPISDMFCISKRNLSPGIAYDFFLRYLI